MVPKRHRRSSLDWTHYDQLVYDYLTDLQKKAHRERAARLAQSAREMLEPPAARAGEDE